MNTLPGKPYIIRLLFCGCFIFVTANLRAQLSLVKDINVKADSAFSAYPDVITPLNGGVIYAATDPVLGRELWWSDGFAKTTVVVKDINPFGDANPGNPLSYIDGLPSFHQQYFVVINNKILFTANDGEHGYELWISDGTSAGTSMVKDIFPGSASSNPTSIVTAGQQVFFVADDGVSGREIWKTDGTTSGTIRVKDIYSGQTSSLANALIPVGNKVFCPANDGIAGVEPWMSDGTEQGTVLIKDINPGEAGSYPSEFVGTDDEIYFTTWGKVWKSDGTSAGTHYFLEGLYAPQSYFNEVLYLMGDPNAGPVLYKSDGTLAGTSPIRTLFPMEGITYSSVRSKVVGNELFFFYSYEDRSQADSNPFNPLLHVNIIERFNPGTASFEEFLVEEVPFFSFFGSSMPGVLHLSRFENNYYCLTGVAESVRINVKESGSDPRTFTYLGNGYGSNFLTVSSNRLFYRGLNSGYLYYNDSELWTSENTIASTRIVKNTFANASSNPSYGKVFKGLFFFLATDSGINHDYLWKSDGTAEGTVKLAPEINLYRRRLVEFKDNLYFVRQVPTGDMELWKTDGTPTGTSLVKAMNVDALIATDNTLFIYSYDSEHGYEWWTTDGTPGGTNLLKEIVTGPTSANLRTFTVYKNKLLFSVDDGIHGHELWQSDGTTSGTKLLKDLMPGSAGSYPGDYHFLEHKGILYFNATDADHGNELWKTDGTEEGTVFFLDVVPGPTWSHANLLGSVNDRMLFETYTETAGMGYIMYRSTIDGTSSEIFFEQYLGDIQVKDNTAYFSYDNDLFVTDGTLAGTKKVSDFSPINYKSTYSVQEILDGKGYLNQNDPPYGSELWTSDGTTKGTKLLADIFPGEPGSYPSEMAKIENTLFFVAQNGTVGRELWRYVFSPSLEVIQNDQLVANNSLLEFPDTELELTPDTIRIKLKNKGEASLDFADNTISLEGTGSNQFGIRASDLSDLAIGDSTMIKLWYDPQQGGSHEAKIVIRTNDPVHPDFTIQMAGESNEILAIENPGDRFINLYPNPSKGDFSVKADKPIRRLSLKDSSGKTVDVKIVNTNSNEAIIHIENPAGIYFLRIDFAKTVSFKKIVILK